MLLMLDLGLPQMAQPGSYKRQARNRQLTRPQLPGMRGRHCRPQGTCSLLHSKSRQQSHSKACCVSRTGVGISWLGKCTAAGTHSRLNTRNMQHSRDC